MKTSLLGALALTMLCVAPSAYAQEGVQLRPIDRATVRLIAMTGVAGARDDTGALRLGVRAAHGSGVYVHRDGWIATAAHVVAHADFLVVVHPGEEVGHEAEVVFVGADHDVALVRVAGRATQTVPMADHARLGMGQAVHASGYPLDPRERWPAAVSGTIGRPLNDGRIQLSMSVNPGNSGGPVITERGELVGIISQGADVDRGAQGFAIMEPIAPLVARARRARREAQGQPSSDPLAVDLLLEQLQARERPATDARVTRLMSAHTEAPPSAALLTVEAVDLQHQVLNDAGARAPFQLGAAALERYNALGQTARRWAQLGAREDDERYAALGHVQAQAPAAGPAQPARAQSAPTTSSAPHVAGPAVAPSEHAPRAEVVDELPPIVGFAFEGSTGLVVDDHDNREPVGGGLVGAGAYARLFLGYSPFFRPALEAGVTLDVGGWRDRPTVAVLASVGMRMELALRSTGVFIRGAWTPGFVGAEARESSTAAGYAIGAGMTLDALEIGLTWREIHRGVATPLRTLTLNVSFEVLP